MGNEIRVVVKRPGEAADITYIENELHCLQKLVGGYIECVTFSDCVIAVNEEGLLLGLRPNCKFRGHRLFGTVLALGTVGDEFCSLEMREACAIAMELDEGVLRRYG